MIGGLVSKGTEEEFRYWSDLGADYVMLGVSYDFFLDRKKTSEIIALKNKYGMNILIHPRPDGSEFFTQANPDAHKKMYESLEIIEHLIKTENLIDKVIIHLSTYNIPNKGYPQFTEKDAITNSASFYSQLNRFKEMTFVLENVYPPGIGWEELGYLPDHFHLFTQKKGTEFCLDTGHMKLSAMTAKDIQELPYKLTCLHLHSNDGTKDQHVPLRKSNFESWKEIEPLLSEDRYITIEVKNEKEHIPNTFRYLRKKMIAP